jgi:hypothetical protein
MSFKFEVYVQQEGQTEVKDAEFEEENIERAWRQALQYCYEHHSNTNDIRIVSKYGEYRF